MKNERRFKWVIRAVGHYLTFFLLVAFVITCCITLFLTVLSENLGIKLTEANINAAAKVTFWNVVLISLIFTFIDGIRRKLTVDIPTKKIADATERMTQGDFNIRIPEISRFATDDKFNEIIGCINKLAEELSGVETLRGDFIANVSHEMKTPLAVIQNYGRLLESPELTEEKRVEYARAITEAARRLADMMTNILKLNRLENQQVFEKPQTFDLGEQLCEVFLQYESVWERREIEIDTDIAENVNISADYELLSLVWSNLFSNAFKFTGEGGKVTLSLEADGEYATVKVSDTGCGMTSDVGERIFEKFYQGDTSRATEGNGLGLALVKRVIDIVDGEIRVESKVGVGSTFTVRLRRANNALEENR